MHQASRSLPMASAQPKATHYRRRLLSTLGRRYRVVQMPTKAGFRFHPKACFLSGRKGAQLLIGSGNLTFGGWRENAEIWTCFDSDKGTAEISAFRDYVVELARGLALNRAIVREIEEAFDFQDNEESGRQSSRIRAGSWVGWEPDRACSIVWSRAFEAVVAIGSSSRLHTSTKMGRRLDSSQRNWGRRRRWCSLILTGRICGLRRSRGFGLMLVSGRPRFGVSKTEANGTHFCTPSFTRWSEERKSHLPWEAQTARGLP